MVRCSSIHRHVSNSSVVDDRNHGGSDEHSLQIPEYAHEVATSRWIGSVEDVPAIFLKWHLVALREENDE